MGLGDTVSKVLLQFKADTSQAKSEIRSLRGEERKAATERLAELEKQNKGIEDQIARYARLGVAVGAGVVAFKAAHAAAKNYLEGVRLQAAAAGANVDKLKAATNGLVEADKLLAFAGKAQAGVWRLNQREMETVLRGAMALRKTMGVELEPTIDSLTEAIAKGSTRALKEFGIEAKDKEEALRKLEAAFKATGGSAALAGDELLAGGVKITDAMDEASESIGKMVVELAPLVDVLAGLVAGVAKFISLIPRIPHWLVPDSSDGGRLTPRQQKLRQGNEFYSKARKLRRQAEIGDWVTQNELKDQYNNGYVTLFTGDSSAALRQGLLRQAAGLEASADQLVVPELVKSAQDTIAAINASIAKAQAESAAEKAAKAGRGSGPRRSSGPGLSLETLSMFGGFGADLSALPGVASQFGQQAFGNWQAGTEQNRLDDVAARAVAQSRAESDAILASWNEAAKKRAEEGTLLETIFGKPTEVGTLTVAITAAAGAFNTLTDAAGAAFEAWITGGKSLKKAFAEAVAEGLKANAVQMLAESIKHAAFAAGSFAFGNLPKAAAHGASALKFAAGAAVMGYMAKQLGEHTGQWAQGGSAGASAGGGGATRTIGSGPAREQDNRPINVYVGAEWAAMSKLEQSAAITRAIQLGKRGSRHIRRS